MISVCMATRNGERYLRPALESILAQLGTEDELVISDDRSDDQTAAIAEAFHDPRIRVVTHEKFELNHPRGNVFDTMQIVGANFFNALRESRGDLLFLADQDDVWLPGKVEACRNALRHADCVVHNCSETDAKLQVVNKRFLPLANAHLSLPQTLVHPLFMGCCMAFTSRYREQFLNPPSFPVEHDTWIGLCHQKRGRVVFLDEPLLLYRRHGNNVSNCFGRSPNSLSVKLLRRFFILRAWWMIPR